MHFHFRRGRSVCASLLAVALGMLADAVAAQTPPQVVYYPRSGGSADLWMITGPVVTPEFSTQRVCETGVGDEVCAILAVVTSSGGTTLSTFTPASSDVRAHLVTSTKLRIVKLGAREPDPGDAGGVRLGKLVVNGSPASLALHTESRWVRADGALATLTPDPIALPEPSHALMLAAGIGLLALIARARARRRVVVGIPLLFAAGLLIEPRPAAAQLYFGRTNFQNAVGPGFLLEDFESLPLNPNGFAAASNGASFGGGAFTYESTTLAADISLFATPDVGGADTGLDGTVLFSENALAPTVNAQPGGDGDHGVAAADDDSFRLTFDPPVDAASVRIAGNTAEGGESIAFRDESGALLASTALPTAANVGYVRRPGEGRIATITVTEATGTDDIVFDDVIWKETVALTVAPFVPRPRLDTWRRFGPAELPVDDNDNLGIDVTAIGDLNDDGVVDIAVGADGADGGGSGRGKVAIAFLERDGTIRRFQIISDEDGGLSGPGDPGGVIADEGGFGGSLAPLGDFDGDGVLDLAVGAQAPGTPGDLFLLFLKPDGTVKDYHRIDESDPQLTGILAANDVFAGSIAVLQDFDGNGTPELAVGAILDDAAGTDAGAVYILFLDTDGSVLDKVKITEGSGGFTGTLDSGDQFGYDVEAIGDLNRDGYPDLAVSARRDDDAGTNQGAVWLLFLDENANVQTALTKKITPDGYSIVNQGLGYFLENGDEFGASLAWIPTPQASTPGVLAVGALLMDAIQPISLVNQGQGALFFLALAPDGTATNQSGVLRTVPLVGATAPGLFTPVNASEMTRLGSAVAYLGDVDEDGFPDVAAGANFADVSGETDVGALYLMFLDGLDATAFADAVSGDTGVSSSANALGPPDGSGAYLEGTGGGTLTVQFVNNGLRRGGDTRADLIIHRNMGTGAADTQQWTIRVSSNGQTYHQVFNGVVDDCLPSGAVCNGRDQFLVDIDGAGIPDVEYRIVQVQQPQGCTIPFLCPDPRVDAIESVNNLNFVADADYDGFPDGSDNCRFTPNPNQTDSDDDGWGDVCDNCPAMANPDQYDGDGDRKGDLCDDGEYFLTRFDEDARLYELRYRCPGDTSVNRLDVGIVKPPGTSALFGCEGPSCAGACEAPCGSDTSSNPALCQGVIVTIPNPPLFYASDDGCTEATGLGARVDPKKSGTLGTGLTSPAGVRPDTLYLRLEGGVGGQPLCNENQNVSLGFLYLGGLLPQQPPVLTSKGVDTPGLGLDASDYEISEAYSGEASDCGGPICTGGFGVENVVSTYGIKLEPAPGQPAGAETVWKVSVQADGQFYRLSFGLQAPPGSGTTPAQLYWQGCNTTPVGPELQRACNGPYTDPYGWYVATTDTGPLSTSSYTLGPKSTDDIPTLLVTLEGILPNDEDVPALNVADASTPLGHVVLTTTPGEPPDLTFTGIELMPVQPALLGAYDEDATSGPDEVSTLDVTLTYASAGSEDSDLDTVRDEDDNCRFLPNTSQTNTGGLRTSVANADNVGDDCSCGDLDFDGRMLLGGPDLAVLMDVVLGVNTSPGTLNRASVVDGKEANLRDLVRMQLGLDGKLSGFHQVCEDGALPLP